MINTFVTFFWRKRLLTQATERLEDRGFRVICLEAGRWSTERDMHRAMAAALDFPDYYGHNLDALNDCLGDVACYGGYDDAPEGAGLVLVLTETTTGSRRPAPGRPRSSWTSSPTRPGRQLYFAAV
ncbi:barstar family protein [Streptomyces sp. NPDC093018]|uniref:barstar family protein n=1 Tax=Streptomyces sp. NPDC093018 TaxID=3155067 RepID=UPI00343FA359